MIFGSIVMTGSPPEFDDCLDEYGECSLEHNKCDL